MRDDGVSSVIGAIVVLAILGTGILYIDAYHVPRQGAAQEVRAAAATEAALLRVAAALTQPVAGPTFHDVPLVAERGTPPLLAGLILSPVRAPGTLALDEGPRVRVSVVTDLPAGGVAADDPVREALPDGKMRYHLVGSRAEGIAAGSLAASVGGAYGSSAAPRLELGALLDPEAPAAALAPAGLAIDGARVSWRLPLLAGPSALVGGADGAQVSLAPGPEGAPIVAKAYALSIVVETDAPAAWAAALEGAARGAGTVSVAGERVELLVEPPAASAGTRGVELSLQVARYEAALAARAR